MGRLSHFGWVQQLRQIIGVDFHDDEADDAFRQDFASANNVLFWRADTLKLTHMLTRRFFGFNRQICGVLPTTEASET